MPNLPYFRFGKLALLTAFTGVLYRLLHAFPGEMLAHSKLSTGFAWVHQCFMIPLNCFGSHRLREDNLVSLGDKVVAISPVGEMSHFVAFVWLVQQLSRCCVFLLPESNLRIGERKVSWEIPLLFLSSEQFAALFVGLVVVLRVLQGFLDHT